MRKEFQLNEGFFNVFWAFNPLFCNFRTFKGVHHTLLSHTIFNCVSVVFSAPSSTMVI